MSTPVTTPTQATATPIAHNKTSETPVPIQYNCKTNADCPLNYVCYKGLCIPSDEN
jgi:hypothetical protein